MIWFVFCNRNKKEVFWYPTITYFVYVLWIALIKLLTLYPIRTAKCTVLFKSISMIELNYFAFNYGGCFMFCCLFVMAGCFNENTTLPFSFMLCECVVFSPKWKDELAKRRQFVEIWRQRGFKTKVSNIIVSPLKLSFQLFCRFFSFWRKLCRLCVCVCVCVSKSNLDAVHKWYYKNTTKLNNTIVIII